MWILNQDYRNPSVLPLKLCLEFKTTFYPCPLYFVVSPFRPYEINYPCPGTPSPAFVVSCGYRSFGVSFLSNLKKPLDSVDLQVWLIFKTNQKVFRSVPFQMKAKGFKRSMIKSFISKDERPVD